MYEEATANPGAVRESEHYRIGRKVRANEICDKLSDLGVPESIVAPIREWAASL